MAILCLCHTPISYRHPSFLLLVGFSYFFVRTLWKLGQGEFHMLGHAVDFGESFTTGFSQESLEHVLI